jgi:hypothetical protein
VARGALSGTASLRRHSTSDTPDAHARRSRSEAGCDPAGSVSVD